MRKIYFVLLCLFLLNLANAQKGSVKGLAFDTISKQPVAGATVTVLEKKDSSLVSFTMTGADGRFEVKGLNNGDYRLLITHVNFHNSNRYFTVNDSLRNPDMGQLVLSDKTKVLEEVVLASEAPPVTLINDTIQYNAGSFKTAPNANVEQLLKKLPGVKVEKDGTIKAQGEKVTKVLVDGKEFFGNDPKVATKNLPADAVDKVQVYDKQSDQAQLTGFEDGNYEKTINLKLKADKKKGMFGKITAAGGDKERYEGRFNINSFKGARQFSAIGAGNNVNAETFSFMDILNFTGELARMQRGGGGNININLSGEDAAAMGMNPYGRNNGITTAWGGGLNYNNIVGKKLDLQSNYFYNRFNPKQETHLQRQYFLPDSSYYYNQNAYSDNRSNNHRVNLNLLYQLDSTSSLLLVPSFNYQETENSTQSDYQTRGEDKSLANEGFSNSRANNRGYNFRNDLSWRKKFARRGRTFSLALQTSFNKSNGDGSLYSINDFYNPGGTLNRRDTLNQQNKTTGDLRGYTARAVYTEPIGRRSLVEFSVSRSDTRSTSEKTTWDYNRSNGKFDQLNNQLTNDFSNTYQYTTAGIRFRRQKGKYNFAVGATWQQAGLEGKIISGIKDSVIKQTFRNLLPNARFQYNFSKFKNISLTYTASTNQPSMAQLQPVPDNSNPLLVRAGNPGLKQEFTNTIMTHLQLVSPYKARNLFFYSNIQFTRNKIVNFDSVNLQTGIRTTKPVNVNGVYQVNSNISYSRPLKFIKATLELSANNSLGKTKQFVNKAENIIRSFTAGPEVRLDFNPNDKLNFTTGAAFNYNKTNYSLAAVPDAEFVSQEYSASVDWQLPKKFFFGTDFTYIINSQRAAGFNTRIPLWNASISRQLMKFNRGELKLSVHDLLNKNIGINRSTNNNYVEDYRVLTLRRYFMLSFTYSLSKTGLNNGGGGGGFRMIMR